MPSDISACLDDDMPHSAANLNAPLSSDPPGTKRASFWERFRQTKFYDLIAASPLIIWYGSSAAKQLPALFHKLSTVQAADIDLHFVVSTLAETGSFVLVLTILIFVLLRGPAKANKRGLIPSIVAIAGTSFAVAVVWLPQIELGLVLSVTSLLLILIGVAFSVYTMMYLGRSFSVMPQARRLVTTGPYSIVRHPLYLGEGAAIIGAMLQYLSPLAVLIIAMQFAFQIRRMGNEEEVLESQFPEYREYKARTARLIPGVY